MHRPILHIGDRNYSSWSLRGWLALRHAGIDFEEQLHPLPELRPGPPVFFDLSPTGRVPVLDLGAGTVIAESLAIAEWAAEQTPGLWPRDPLMRALARSAAAIMHAGFAALRKEAPMNLRRRTDASRMTEAGLGDAQLMDSLWRGWLARSGGPWLFGDWSMADAMYAPAVTRFVTYGIPRSTPGDRYIDAIMAEPHMQAWIAAAMAETTRLPDTDNA
jgi:glutathione S-transferase